MGHNIYVKGNLCNEEFRYFPEHFFSMHEVVARNFTKSLNMFYFNTVFSMLKFIEHKKLMHKSCYCLYLIQYLEFHKIICNKDEKKMKIYNFIMVFFKKF